MTAKRVSNDRPPVLGGPGGCSRRDPASPRLSEGGASSSEGAPSSSLPDDAFEPLRERAISREVWEARGYIAYYGKHHPRHNPETVKAALEGYDLSAGQRGTYTRFTNGARDAKDDSRDGCRRIHHDGHGHGLIMLKHPVPRAGPVLPQLKPYYAVRTGRSTEHRHDDAFSNPEHLKRHLTKCHDGLLVPGWKKHEHPDFAKYTFPGNAKHNVWHDHATDPAFDGPRGPEKLRHHLRSQHRRTPKNDAVLTEILRTNAEATVFNAPSVTLWNAPELPVFAELFLDGGMQLLGGGEKPLVPIVCDADHHTNQMVVRHALFCRETLRGYGVTCCIVAPPDDRDDQDELRYKGVDDFLAEGGKLDDLVVFDREAGFSLALHADEDGTIKGTISGLARVLGVRRDAERVVETLRNHINQGFVTADRKLVLARDEWTGGLGWEGKPADWPKFTIREDLRHTTRFVRLGDYEPQPAAQSLVDLFDEAREQAKLTGVGIKEAVETAIRETARRHGTTEGNVRRKTADYREGLSAARDEIVVFARMLGIPRDEIAALAGVSEKTVSRIEKSQDEIEERARKRGMPPLWVQEPKEKQMITLATDEQLAADAARLHTIAGELMRTAIRLQVRFPGSKAVTEAVELFIASVGQDVQPGGMKGSRSDSELRDTLDT